MNKNTASGFIIYVVWISPVFYPVDLNAGVIFLPSDDHHGLVSLVTMG